MYPVRTRHHPCREPYGHLPGQPLQADLPFPATRPTPANDAVTFHACFLDRECRGYDCPPDFYVRVGRTVILGRLWGGHPLGRSERFSPRWAPYLSVRRVD